MAYGSHQAETRKNIAMATLQYRRIEGKGKNQINAKLCSIIGSSGISPEETDVVNNLSSVSHRTTSELSVEREGVKLDI